MKIILFLVLTYFSFVFSYTYKYKYNNKPFEYCCYDDIIEVEIALLVNVKNLVLFNNLFIKLDFFFKIVNKDKILVDLHRRQLVNIIEKKIKDLEMEEEL